MFEFQKLDVYQKAKRFHRENELICSKDGLSFNYINQLSRASLSVVLNIAEGAGRFSNADRRHFFVMSRSSIFECVAILEILLDTSRINQNTYDSILKMADELSRILFAFIKKLTSK